MKNKRGFALVWVIVIVVILSAGVVWVVRDTGRDDTAIEQPVSKALVTEEDYEAYCKEEVAKLPDAPFKFQKRNEPKYSIASPPFLKLVPEGKLSGACTVAFDFDRKIAYESLGIEYSFDSSKAREFAGVIESLMEDNLQDYHQGWQRQREVLTDRELSAFSARFAPLFMKQNPELGVTEYVHASFGVPFYMKYLVVEN